MFNVHSMHTRPMMILDNACIVFQMCEATTCNIHHISNIEKLSRCKYIKILLKEFYIIGRLARKYIL